MFSTVLFAQDSYIAIPTNSEVLVDGKPISFGAYNIDGNNYFKLRDLAMALSETDKYFNVNWYGNISLHSNNFYPYTKYKPVGNELSQSSLAERVALPYTSEIYLDDNKITLSAYTIDESNYFKLREISKIFDFGVEWNENADSIIINTEKSYTPTPYIPIVATNNSEIIGNVKHSDLAVFISEMPIISYIVDTDNTDVSEEQLFQYLKNTMIRNIYIIAEDLSNYGFDVVKNEDEKTLYIIKNELKKYGLMDGEIVNSPTNTDKVYNLYRNDKYVVMDGKKVASYSIGDKTLISVTELMNYGELIYTEKGDNNEYDADISVEMVNIDLLNHTLEQKYKTISKVNLKEENQTGNNVSHFFPKGTGILGEFSGEIIDDLKNGIVVYNVSTDYTRDEFIGYYKNDKKNGYGIIYQNCAYLGNGSGGRGYISYKRGLFEDDIFIDGVTYRSARNGGNGTHMDGYRYEGAMFNGYLRKSVVEMNNPGHYHFGYHIQCEGEVKNGEFCGYYRSYDVNGKLVFEGQYSDFIGKI